MRINIAGPVALALMVACDGSSGELSELPEPFTHATAMGDCAPWDGAAVSILLTTAPLDSTMTPTAPYLRLAIWRDKASLKDGLFVWPSDAQVGAGSYCATADSCEVAQTGMVQFRETGGDSMLVGEFELNFPHEDPFSGGFRAVWLSHTVLCG